MELRSAGEFAAEAKLLACLAKAPGLNREE
jgi:hypothetical protein